MKPQSPMSIYNEYIMDLILNNPFSKIFSLIKKSLYKVIMLFRNIPFLVRWVVRKGCRVVWKSFLCKMNVHRWVMINKRSVGLCWACDCFYETAKGMAVSKIDKANRSTRRRIRKGLV
jgi:hypothetical protein